MPNQDQLISWGVLADHVSAGARVAARTRVDGGNFTDVYRLELALSAGEPMAVVARIMREESPKGIVDKLVSVLPVLREHGVPGPNVRWSDPSGATVGRPTIVFDWIEGDAYASAPPRRDRARAEAEVLARIHSTPLDNLSLSTTYSTLPPPHLRRWVSQTPAADTAVHLVDQLAPGIRDDEPSLVHGDYWSGNLLWKRGTLVGVLDWDATAVGSRGVDVAKTRLDLALRFGPKAVDDFTAHYERLAGPAANQAFWDLREALSGFPDPGLYWLPTYEALGSSGLDAGLMRRRFDAYISRCLDAI